MAGLFWTIIVLTITEHIYASFYWPHANTSGFTLRIIANDTNVTETDISSHKRKLCKLILLLCHNMNAKNNTQFIKTILAVVSIILLTCYISIS